MYFQSPSQNIITRALMTTTTEPSASPRMCRNTPRMFNWALVAGGGVGISGGCGVGLVEWGLVVGWRCKWVLVTGGVLAVA